MTTVLSVQDLRVTFDRGGEYLDAVKGVSFSVDAGRTLAIIGESGSGKTVTSRAVMGLLPEYAEVSGSVRLEGQELVGLKEKAMRRYRGTGLATVLQDPARSLNPTTRVGTQIAEGMLIHGIANRRTARADAVELLRLVRLPDPERRHDEYPHQLSGGMRQRVMIAIALACRPKLLIADEPTTALDVTTQAGIMKLLRELQAQLNMAVILISHNIALAAGYADEVAVMYAGKVVEHAETAKFFAGVRMPYTELLLKAVPRVEGPVDGGARDVDDRLPDGGVQSAGCAFAPRCRSAGDRCWEEEPTLETDEDGHSFACWRPVRVGVRGR